MADPMAQIEAIALRNPLVYMVLMMHRDGRLSQEEALVWMVQLLVKQCDLLIERLTSQLATSVIPADLDLIEQLRKRQNARDSLVGYDPSTDSIHAMELNLTREAYDELRVLGVSPLAAIVDDQDEGAT